VALQAIHLQVADRRQRRRVHQADGRRLFGELPHHNRRQHGYRDASKVTKTWSLMAAPARMTRTGAAPWQPLPHKAKGSAMSPLAASSAPWIVAAPGLLARPPCSNPPQAA